MLQITKTHVYVYLPFNEIGLKNIGGVYDKNLKRWVFSKGDKRLVLEYVECRHPELFEENGDSEDESRYQRVLSNEDSSNEDESGEEESGEEESSEDSSNEDESNEDKPPKNERKLHRSSSFRILNSSSEDEDDIREGYKHMRSQLTPQQLNKRRQKIKQNF